VELAAVFRSVPRAYRLTRLAGQSRIAGDVLVLSRQAAHENAPDRGEYREVAGVAIIYLANQHKPEPQPKKRNSV
jgi:hypothetical protein